MFKNIKNDKLLNFKLIAILLLSIQFIFWYGIKNPFNEKSKVYWSGTKSIKPEIEVLPKVPSEEILKASAFGDEELAFRFNTYKLQFAGDGFGQVTPLKNYDYAKLYQWWKLLDEINSDSDLLPFMVSYYFAATQSPKEQIPYVVDFLEEHSDKHPEKKWWWYAQAVYNANIKMEDARRALEIAEKLAALPKELDIPIWTRQLGAFIYEKEGEYQKSCDVIVNIVKDYSSKKLTEGELNFTFYFINERLKTMIDKENESGLKLQVSDDCRALMETKKAQDLKAFRKVQK